MKLHCVLYHKLLRGVGLSALSGLLLIVSFPGGWAQYPSLSGVAWVALVPLLLTIHSLSVVQAFWCVLFTGVIFTSGTLHWIPAVLHDNTGISVLSSWLLPGLAMLALSSMFACACTGALVLHRMKRVQWVLIFPAGWVAVEYIAHYFPFGGLPWLSLGYSQYSNFLLIQSADIAGVLGVSFLIVLINALLAEMMRATWRKRTRHAALLCAVVTGVMLLNLGYGVVRSGGVSQGQLAISPLRIAGVAGHVPQSRKWDLDSQSQLSQLYRRLSYEAVSQGVDLLIWPEASIPYHIDRSSTALSSRSVPRISVPVLVGALTSDGNDHSKQWNSALLIEQGSITARYDKQRLVPLGEYVPPIVPVTRAVTTEAQMQVGSRSELMHIAGHPFGVQICFEDIFPALARQWVKHGAKMLINLSNVGWYEDAAGAVQQQMFGVFRAIENRVPYIRLANRGKTTAFDASGAMISSASLEHAWSIMSVAPYRGGSLYVLWGDLPVLIVSVLFVLSLVVMCVIPVMAWLRRKYCDSLQQGRRYGVSALITIAMLLCYHSPVYASPEKESGYAPFQFFSNGGAIDIATGAFKLEFTDLELLGKGQLNLAVKRIFHSAQPVETPAVTIDPKIFTGYTNPAQGRQDYRVGEPLNTNYVCMYLRDKFPNDFGDSCAIEGGGYVDQFAAHQFSNSDLIELAASVVDPDQHIPSFGMKETLQHFPFGSISTGGNNLSWAPPQAKSQWSFALGQYQAALLFRNINPFAREGAAIAFLIRQDGTYDVFDQDGQQLGVSDDEHFKSLQFFKDGSDLPHIVSAADDLDVPDDAKQQLGDISLLHNTSRTIDVDALKVVGANGHIYTFSRYDHNVLYARMRARNIVMQKDEDTQCTDEGCYQNYDKDGDGYYDQVPTKEYRIAVENIPHWRVDYYLLTEDRNQFNNAINYSYPQRDYPNNYVVQMYDSLNRSVVLRYDSDNVIRLQAPGGRVWRYEHDGNGMIRRVVDPVGNETLVRYDQSESNLPVVRHWDLIRPSPDAFMELRYPNGGILRYEMVKDVGDFAHGQVVVTEFPDDRDVTTYYQKFFNLFRPEGKETTTEVHQSDGSMFRYIHSTPALLHAKSKDKTPILVRRELNPGQVNARIDEYNWEIVELDSGVRVNGMKNTSTTENGVSYGVAYTYDDEGRQASYTDSLQSTANFTYASGEGIADPRMAHQQRQRTRQVIRKKMRIEGAGEDTVTLTYHRDGADACSQQFVPIDQVTRVTRQLNQDEPEIVQSTCFDADGNVTQSTKLFEGSTHYTYIDGAHMSSVTTSSGTATVISDHNLGRATQVTMADGRTINYSYDSLGRVIKKAYSNGSSITYEYQSRYNVNGHYDANRIITTTYDAARDQSRVIARDFDGMDRRIQINDGGQIRTYTYGPNKKLSNMVFPGDRIYHFTYDGLGRMLSINFPGGKVVDYAYTTLLDEGSFRHKLDIHVNGVLFNTLYRDAMSKVVKSVQYPGGEQVPAETKYLYDQFDNMVALTSPEGLVTKNIYDHHGRLRGRLYPDGNRVDLNPLEDATGLLDSMVIQDDLLGPSTVTYDFDDQQRMTSIDFPATDGQELNDYALEYVGPYISAIESAYQRTEFSYAADGALIGIAHDVEDDELSQKIQYGGDGFGKTYWMVYPDGSRIYYLADQHGRTTEVKSGAIDGKTVAAMTYHDTGKLATITYANKTKTSYEYDEAGRVVSMVIDLDGELLNQLQYGYDKIGNKVSTSYLDGARVEYKYDGINRLIEVRYYHPESEAPHNIQRYAYDNDGNRISYSDAYKQINSSYINGRLSAMSIGSHTKREFAYDVRGNLLSETELQDGVIQFQKTFSYDLQNRVIAAEVKNSSQESRSVAYEYDFASRRTSKSLNGVLQRRYVYGKAVDPLMELDDSGEVERLFLYVGGKRIATFADESYEFHHIDDLGNVLHSTDDAGVLTESLRYDPFGNINFHIGHSLNRYHFASKEYDPTIGLYYFGARYYDASVGRFITRDPMEQGMNHYVFAKNNPLTNIEFFGMGSIVKAVVSVVAIVAGVALAVASAGVGPLAYVAASLVVGGVGGLTNGFGLEVNISGSFGGPGGISAQGSVDASVRDSNGQNVRISGCRIAGTCFRIGGGGESGDSASTTVSGSSSTSTGGAGGSAGGALGGDFFEIIQDIENLSSDYEPINPFGPNDPSQFPGDHEIYGDGGGADITGDTSLSGTKLPESAPGIENSPFRDTPNPFDTPQSEIDFSGQGSAPATSSSVNLPFDFEQQDDTPASVVQDALSGISANNDVGDPVMLSSGDLLQVNSDLKIAGRGIDYEFVRTYRSRVDYDGPLGFGWDHNYNQRLVILEDGAVIRRFDGRARFDDYHLEDNHYRAPPGRFEYLERFTDDTTVITDQSGTKLQYRADGRLSTITDRNGNQLVLQYEVVTGGARLDSVIDTLGREIDYQYNEAGRLVRVVDFSGRQIRFVYDEQQDLVAVHSPSTEQFPVGKVTTYTYSSGFPESDRHRNHNLLTITDPAGQVFLRNEYSISDRVVKQYFGERAFEFSYRRMPEFYSCVTDSDPGLLVSRTRVTDRSGNVTDFHFNCQGNPVRLEEFTRGLNSGDPASYQTQYSYNDDGLVTAVIYPEGNQTEYDYQDTSEIPFAVAQRARGNLIAMRRTPDEKRGGGASLVTQYQYEPLYNQVVRVVDARGGDGDTFATRTRYDYQEGMEIAELAERLSVETSEVVALYDGLGLILGDLNNDGVTNQASGNPVQIIHPVAINPSGAAEQLIERFQYNDHGELIRHIDAANTVADLVYDGGYLTKIVRDVGGLEQTQSVVRDELGRVVQLINPLGATTQYSYDALDNVIQVLNTVGHVTSYVYDANDNLVQIDRQHLDEQGEIIDGNPLLTTRFEYTMLDRLAVKHEEVDTSKSLLTEYRYDANENLTHIIQPGGDRIEIDYDERDYPIRVMRGAGSPDVVTMHYRYNANGKLIEQRNALNQATRATYDGFDRVIAQTDPLGNRVNLNYNEIDQVIQIQHLGPSAAGENSEMLLAQTEFEYDAFGRRVQTFAANVVNGDVVDVRSTQHFYSLLHRIVKTVDPLGAITQWNYDPLGRLLAQTDAVGNETHYSYDNGDRLVSILLRDLHYADGLVDYERTFDYDDLDRVVSKANQAGHHWKYQYDSLGRLRTIIDPLDEATVNAGATVGTGNITRMTYDGLGRRTAVQKELRAGGVGSGALLDTLTTTYTWDASSRLVSMLDSAGNTTSYSYDAVGRRTAINMPDSSVYVFAYDIASRLKQFTMPNGYALHMAYDDAGRLTKRSIRLDGGIVGAEVMVYDGLGRMLSSSTMDADDQLIHPVTYQYDSFGNVTAEQQGAHAIARTFNANNSVTTLGYPNGDSIVIDRDPIGRIQALVQNDGQSIASFLYAKRDQRASVTLGNGFSGEFSYNAFGQLATWQWGTGDNHVISARALHYDKIGNVRIAEALHANGTGNRYGYDSLARLSTASLGVPDVTASLGVPVPDNFDSHFDYSYDAVHNFNSVVQKQVPADPTQDLEIVFEANTLNQYVAGTPTLGDASLPKTEYQYDANGNLIADDVYKYSYTWRNTISEVRWLSDDSLVAQYQYDALGRRITKYDALSGESIRYLYDEWQVLEERDQNDNNALRGSYVYGALDQPVRMLRDGQVYYYHYNHQGSIEALTDAGQDVVERYAYDPFGVTTVTSGDGVSLAESAVDNPYLYTARRIDNETGLYYYRHRYYSPELGRFIQRDPLGYLDGENLYAYVQANPLNATDPFGLIGERLHNIEAEIVCGGSCIPDGPPPPEGKIIGGALLGIGAVAAAPVVIPALAHGATTIAGAAQTAYYSYVVPYSIGAGIAASHVTRVAGTRAYGMYLRGSTALQQGASRLYQGAQRLATTISAEAQALYVQHPQQVVSFSEGFAGGVILEFDSSAVEPPPLSISEMAGSIVGESVAYQGRTMFENAMQSSHPKK